MNDTVERREIVGNGAYYDAALPVSLITVTLSIITNSLQYHIRELTINSANAWIFTADIQAMFLANIRLSLPTTFLRFKNPFNIYRL